MLIAIVHVFEADESGCHSVDEAMMWWPFLALAQQLKLLEAHSRRADTVHDDSDLINYFSFKIPRQSGMLTFSPLMIFSRGCTTFS
jgi:hypothetical protein